MKRFVALIPLAALAVLTGCGAEREPSAPAAAPSAVRTPDDQRPLIVTPALKPKAAPKPKPKVKPAAVTPKGCNVPATPIGTGLVSYAAWAANGATAYRLPSGVAIEQFDSRNVNGAPTVFGVVGTAGCGGERWLKVQLPIRPNQVTGWVRAKDVRLERVRASIVIDLSDRRITLSRSGKPVFTAPIALGAPGTPTPTGRYYINQRLIAPDPNGPYGPAALGISAFSNVLTGWAQGGPVAIHGTNRPDLIGHAVSHGCVRVRNDVLLRMWGLAPAGTPVVIRV
jgi:lipoprotein-anchoring transpeptidase ErfK/SrfK